MKSHFCDDCIHDILETVEDVFFDEAVIYDAEKKKFYPITEGDLQIGEYELHTSIETAVIRSTLNISGTEIEFIGI